MLEGQNKLLIVLGAVAALVAAVGLRFSDQFTPTSPTIAASELAETMRDVAKRWPQLPHITTASLAGQFSSGGVVVFDVRQSQEFAVSHLPNAIYVSADISVDDFMARYGDQVGGKLVVFYCSVGVRSSTLAAQVSTALKEKGAREVADLAGGIFAWHNEARPLVDAHGDTDFVHPFDQSWGRLVARQQLTRMKP